MHIDGSNPAACITVCCACWMAVLGLQRPLDTLKSLSEAELKSKLAGVEGIVWEV